MTQLRTIVSTTLAGLLASAAGSASADVDPAPWAERLAAASEAAYYQKELNTTRVSVLQPLGLEEKAYLSGTIEFFGQPLGFQEVLVAQMDGDDSGPLIIAFAGTSLAGLDDPDTEDLTTNMDADLKPLVRGELGSQHGIKSACGFSGCKVHNGYNERAEDALGNSTLEGYVNSGRELLITGHSLGGGVAQLYGLYLKSQGKSVSVATFAGPMVGNQLFADVYGSSMTAARYVIEGDPIPSMPLCEEEVVDDIGDGLAGFFYEGVSSLFDEDFPYYREAGDGLLFTLLPGQDGSAVSHWSSQLLEPGDLTADAPQTTFDADLHDIHKYRVVGAAITAAAP